MSVIPAPLRATIVSPAESGLILNGPVTVSFSGEGADGVAGYLTAYLNSQLDLDAIAVSEEDASSIEGTGVICICIQKDLESLGRLPNTTEAYRLSITDTQILIQARASHGLFNGIQTLIQLLPPLPTNEIKLENMQITDAPRFKWRGVLLDVGRHYFSFDFLKKVLDLMAFYKMNRFHWHLTEDQGWRIEIKKYPRLTEFGAWRGARKYGGFYTQEQVKELIAYAADRHIEIIPEIEMPGHACAALACYPELSCAGVIREVPDYWGVQEEVYCAGNDKVLQFCKDVLTEVMELFPSRHIHIGGDECPKTRWNQCGKCQRRIKEEGLADEYSLQSWFIGQINTFLRQHKKTLIGWDEILEGGLNPGSMVMSWRGITGGVRAAKEGHEVIMTPTSHCYFDYRQSLRSDEPGAWFAMLPLEMVYDFDPIPPPPDYAQRPDPIPEDDTYPSHAFPESSGREAENGNSLEEDMSDGGDNADAMSLGHERLNSNYTDFSGLSELPGAAEEDPGGGASMSHSSFGSSAVETGELVYSTSVPAAYQHRPEDDWTLDSRHASLIVGGQANVWTEYISDEETVEYMLLPRLCAMSEALWSPAQDRVWPSFVARLKQQLPHLDARDFKYRPLG